MNKWFQSSAVAKWFIIPWSLVSAWSFLPWFNRMYEQGQFRYNPNVLQFEMNWSRALLLVFCVVGMALYQSTYANMPRWAKTSYLLLITNAASLLFLDLIISLTVTPAP